TAVLEAAGEIADRRQKRLHQFPACVGVAASGRDHQIPLLQNGESLLNHRPPVGRRSRFSHPGLSWRGGGLLDHATTGGRSEQLPDPERGRNSERERREAKASTSTATRRT